MSTTGIFEAIGFLFIPVLLIIGIVFYKRRAAAGQRKTKPNTKKIIALAVLAAIFMADMITSLILLSADLFWPVMLIIKIPIDAAIILYLIRAIIKEKRVGLRRARVTHN